MINVHDISIKNLRREEEAAYDMDISDKKKIRSADREQKEDDTWLFSGLRRPPVPGVPGIFTTAVLLAMEPCGGVLAGSGFIDEKLDRLIRAEGPNWFIICLALDFSS